MTYDPYDRTSVHPGLRRAIRKQRWKDYEAARTSLQQQIATVRALIYDAPIPPVGHEAQQPPTFEPTPDERRLTDLQDELVQLDRDFGYTLQLMETA